MIDTDALRKLCKSATPGPWEVTNERFVRQSNDPRHVIARCSKADQLVQQNAEYIAAANPAVVLALLDEIAAMREDLNDARSEFEHVAAGLNDAAQRIARQSQTISRLQDIEAAARNLAKVKGRHNSELAMDRLLEALE